MISGSLSRRNFAVLLGVSIGVSVFPGCQVEGDRYQGVKRIDERLTAKEIETFLTIAESLQPKTLSTLPPVISKVPQWPESRALPVNQLMSEEQSAYARRLLPSWYEPTLEKSPFLLRVLRRERITHEQFSALILAVGFAVLRSETPEEADLDAIFKRSEQNLASLRVDDRVFSRLAEDRESLHSVQRLAAWITVQDRVRTLMEVPQQNPEVVREYRDRLNAILPAEFLRNPLADLTTIIDDHGVPFQELTGLTDDRIVWSRSDAVMGRDTDAAPEASSKDKRPSIDTSISSEAELE